MDFDFETYVAAGAMALAVAALAWFADRRRMRRSDPDAVGFMPWTGVFFWALLAVIALAGLAVRAWLAA